MDTAGCLFGLSYFPDPSEPYEPPGGYDLVILKVTRYRLDSEVHYNRSVTSDHGCYPHTEKDWWGGLFSGLAYVDLANTSSFKIISELGNGGFILYEATFIVDVDDLPGFRYGWQCRYAELIINGYLGESAPGRMQQVEFEIHSESPLVWYDDLT